MKTTLKRYFIPHEENGYHPHILHTKRTVLYAAVSLLAKGLVFGVVLFLPNEVFMLPDVLEKERSAIIAMTNALRERPLAEHALLDRSAYMKAADMAAHDYFDHMGPANRNLRYFLGAVEYPYAVAGENLAMGFSSAADVLNAWKESPTHFANLVDTDYEDIGVGIETGMYKGVPTVFLTQHFGRRKRASLPVSSAFGTPLAFQTAADAGAKRETKGEKVSLLEESGMEWQEHEDGSLRIFATVHAPKGSSRGTVAVRHYELPLQESPDEPSVFRGEMTVPETPESFFRVVTVPVARITGPEGQDIRIPAPWTDPLVVHPGPLEKYLRSKSSLPALAALFSVERGVYTALIVFFGAALLVSIVVEIRKQHPHVIFRTAMLLGLFAVLLKI